MKFSILACALMGLTSAQQTTVELRQELDAMISAHTGPNTSRQLAHDRVPAHDSCEEDPETGVQCPCMALACEIESPADVVNEPAGGLRDWLAGQEWKSFESRVGMPGARDAGGFSIDYVKVSGTGTKGSMIMVPGQSEACTKYDEIMYDMTQEGYSPIYCIDHRGQGKSGRMLPEALKGHIEDGSDFIEDFTDFVNEVGKDIALLEDQRLFLTCHSMGCAITFGYTMREYKAQRSQLFNAIVAFAPLIQPNTSPFPYSVAVGIGNTMNALGMGDNWAPTLEKTFEEAYLESGFLHSTTTSYTRWARAKENCVLNKDVTYHAGQPDEHLGQCQSGVTGNFASQLFTWYDRFYDFYTDFVTDKAKLNVAILLQQAGGDDTVINAPQDLFCSVANVNCKISVKPDSEHNIWQEVDSIRSPAMTEAWAFFDEHQTANYLQAALPPVKSCGWSWWTWKCFVEFWPRLGTFMGFGGIGAAAGIFMIRKRSMQKKGMSSMTKSNEMGEFNKSSESGAMSGFSDGDLMSEMQRRGLASSASVTAKGKAILI